MQSAGYYIFARQVGTREVISVSVNQAGAYSLQIKGVKDRYSKSGGMASKGWSQIVVRYERYGIGVAKLFRIEVEVRGNGTV